MIKIYPGHCVNGIKNLVEKKKKKKGTGYFFPSYKSL